MRALVLLAALLAWPVATATARTLLVGTGQAGGSEALPTLADAVRAALDGDTIRLAPGVYFECATLLQNDLVLEGAVHGTDPGAVLSDKTCEGKAVLVARGRNLTVRDLTLARARVADMNGAGIRLEAQGLILERVRFDNNQIAVLAGRAGPGSIRIADCRFEGGGVPGPHPTAALAVGAVALLVVERSVFAGVKGGQVSTAADHTVLSGNRIQTGVEPGAAPAVQALAGMLEMRDNVLTLGPNPPEHDAAVLAMGDGAALRGNRMDNGTGRPQNLLLDWMAAAPTLDGNTVAPGDALVSSDGAWRHRAGTAARDAMGAARAGAGAAKSAIKGLLGR